MILVKGQDISHVIKIVISISITEAIKKQIT